MMKLIDKKETLLDDYGHIFRSVGRTLRMDGPLVECLRCGKSFKLPLEGYERETCEPGSGPALKLFLDDERSTPVGYSLRAKTADECIELLATKQVWHVSLDHDLADEHYAWQVTTQKSGGYNAPLLPWPRDEFDVLTGYAVLQWMKETDSWVPDIQVHSLSTGADDMMAFLKEHAPEWVTHRRVKPKEI